MHTTPNKPLINFLLVQGNLTFPHTYSIITNEYDCYPYVNQLPYSYPMSVLYKEKYMWVFFVLLWRHTGFKIYRRFKGKGILKGRNSHNSSSDSWVVINSFYIIWLNKPEIRKKVHNDFTWYFYDFHENVSMKTCKF